MLFIVVDYDGKIQTIIVFKTQSPATVHHPEFQCGQHTHRPYTAWGGNDLHQFKGAHIEWTQQAIHLIINLSDFS